MPLIMHSYNITSSTYVSSSIVGLIFQNNGNSVLYMNGLWGSPYFPHTLTFFNCTFQHNYASVIGSAIFARNALMLDNQPSIRLLRG
jgi:hypothetical protein